MNILFLPRISAILPKGRTKTAVGKINEVATQLIITESMSNSVAIVGSAMTTEDHIKAMRKEVVATTNRIIFLLVLPVIVSKTNAKPGLSRN